MGGLSIGDAWRFLSLRLARARLPSFTTTATPRAAYSGPINFRAFHPSKTNSLPVFPLIFQIAWEIGIVRVSRNLSNSNLFSCKSFSKFFAKFFIRLRSSDRSHPRKKNCKIGSNRRREKEESFVKYSAEGEGKTKNGSGSVGRVRSRHDQQLMDKFNFSAHCLRLVAVIGAHCSSDRNTRAGEGYTDGVHCEEGGGGGQVG